MPLMVPLTSSFGPGGVASADGLVDAAVSAGGVAGVSGSELDATGAGFSAAGAVVGAGFAPPQLIKRTLPKNAENGFMSAHATLQAA